MVLAQCFGSFVESYEFFKARIFIEMRKFIPSVLVSISMFIECCKFLNLLGAKNTHYFIHELSCSFPIDFSFFV